MIMDEDKENYNPQQRPRRPPSKVIKIFKQSPPTAATAARAGGAETCAELSSSSSSSSQSTVLHTFFHADLEDLLVQRSSRAERSLLQKEIRALRSDERNHHEMCSTPLGATPLANTANMTPLLLSDESPKERLSNSSSSNRSSVSGKDSMRSDYSFSNGDLEQAAQLISRLQLALKEEHRSRLEAEESVSRERKRAEELDASLCSLKWSHAEVTNKCTLLSMENFSLQGELTELKTILTTRDVAIASSSSAAAEAEAEATTLAAEAQARTPAAVEAPTEPAPATIAAAPAVAPSATARQEEKRLVDAFKQRLKDTKIALKSVQNDLAAALAACEKEKESRRHAEKELDVLRARFSDQSTVVDRLNAQLAGVSLPENDQVVAGVSESPTLAAMSVVVSAAESSSASAGSAPVLSAAASAGASTVAAPRDMGALADSERDGEFDDVSVADEGLGTWAETGRGELEVEVRHVLTNADSSSSSPSALPILHLQTSTTSLEKSVQESLEKTTACPEQLKELINRLQEREEELDGTTACLQQRKHEQRELCEAVACLEQELRETTARLMQREEELNEAVGCLEQRERELCETISAGSEMIAKWGAFTASVASEKVEEGRIRDELSRRWLFTDLELESMKKKNGLLSFQVAELRAGKEVSERKERELGRTIEDLTRALEERE